MDPVSSLFGLTRKFWTICSGRYLNQSTIRFIAISIILITTLTSIIAFLTSSGGRTIYGSWSGVDYSCFYIAGKILNEYSPSRLYDFHLQSELLHSLLPEISLTEQLPYINPPFFALIFKPLSRLPFMVSYFVWISVSVVMYIYIFRLFWQSLNSMPEKSMPVALLLALSFEPFIIETIFGGNSSILGFTAFALFLYFISLNKDLLSGMSIGLLLYKPTLLIIILPMLFVSRKFKILLGFGICSIILVLISLSTVGLDSCKEYMTFLIGTSNMTLKSELIFRTFKYVDIFSFSHLLFGNVSPVVLIFIFLVSFSFIIFSIKLWYNFSNINKSNQELLLASVITLTTIINLHFAIYDTTILVLPILLTINVMYRHSAFDTSTKLTCRLEALIVAIYVISWISQPVALLTGLQLITLVIAILGIYQISLAHSYSKATEFGKAQ